MIPVVIVIDEDGIIFNRNAFGLKKKPSVRPNLPYQGIARRAIVRAILNDPLPYNKDIDIEL